MKKSIVLVVLLLLVSSVFISCKESNESNTLGTNEVVATVNGVNITRSEIADKLKEAEKNAIIQYVDEYLLEDFYKDVEITDTELTLQIEILKGQVGEQQWDSYLQYMGYTNEEDFKELVKMDLKKQKKKGSYTIEVSEEEIKSKFESSMTDYQVLSGNIVFFDNQDEYVSASNMLKQKDITLEVIASALNKEIYPNENVSFSFNGFSKPMEDMVVGDLVITSKESGTLALINVTKVSKSFDDVKDIVKEALINEKGESLIEKDIDDFYNTAKVEVLGEVLQ